MTLPIETITQAMRNSMEIYTLRQLSIKMNGNAVSVNLLYCSWSSMQYSVTGRDALGKDFAESFWTQDEAEQEYILRAGYVMGAASEMFKQQEKQLNEAQAKINGERSPGPNYSSIADDAPVDVEFQRDMQRLLADAGM